jgi:hypothetical protein
MSKWKLLAAALGIFVVHAVAGAGKAHAQSTIGPPPEWGSAAVNVYVGNIGTSPWAIFFNQSTGQCDNRKLGNEVGLITNYFIQGNSGNDFLIVVGGLGTRFDVCGLSLTTLNFNGHFLDVQGLGGDDFVFNGLDDSFGWGGENNDTVQTFSAIGRALGGNGNDRVFGTSSVSTDRLFGEAGFDCLSDPGNAHEIFNCGSEADFYVSPASGKISCDFSVSSC